MTRAKPRQRRTYRCTSPHVVHWAAAASNLRVRCRRCEGCLNVRETHWVLAAAREQVRAKKTWFITLTFRPADRLKVFSDASALHQISPRLSQSQRLCRAAGVAVTLWLKRVRRAGFGLRYMVVPEPHRDGFPHFHALVFDTKGRADLREALESAWEWGFTKCVAVKDARALRYVCKYLAKERFGRVRASKQFGVYPELEGRPIWDPTVRVATRAKQEEEAVSEANDLPPPPVYSTQD